ncbi:MAG: rRNA (cytosine1402-N4)-methyltransferase [Thermomicrobiales bacterium]|nr:rRNA (cytosine1402-N4)-methyltransferase [Thermomicrobiales bacterium]
MSASHGAPEPVGAAENGQPGLNASHHRPVLLAEAVAALDPHPEGRYLDGTFGGGGHTRAILEASTPDGTVLALDADEDAVARGRTLAAEPGIGDRLRLVHGNFANLAGIARAEGMAPLHGVLLDLGLSSFQLDSAQRGFAFRFTGPLDMRFDRSAGQPASVLVNTLPAEDLTQLLWRFGEEPRARRIVQVIIRERERAPIETTARLAEIVSAAVGGRRGADTHPATRTFQALRIATNSELAALEQALEGALSVLAPGGRLAVISFHSLEDRMVKQFIRRESATCICPPEQPICTCDHHPRLRPMGKAVKPGAEELAVNPRSRSAILRVAERLADSPAKTVEKERRIR